MAGFGSCSNGCDNFRMVVAKTAKLIDVAVATTTAQL